LQPLQPATNPETPSADAQLEELFRVHGRDVFKTAYRVTGSESDAEDVVQTVFLRLLANRHAGRVRRDEAGAYLRRAATNASLDALRRRRTRAAVALDDAPSDSLADAAPSAERQASGLGLRKALREGLANLNPRAAEAFVLRHLEGLSNGEVASALGTSAPVVAVTLHRARRSLQKHLSNNGYARQTGWSAGSPDGERS
jgi:RNA polymerase sigma-70 factor (ECF subfamily)